MKTPGLPVPAARFLPGSDLPGAPEPGQRGEPASSRQSDHHGVILLVDDSDQDHELIAAALGECGRSGALRWARSHDEAVAYLQGRPPFDDRLKNPAPALVLLDIQMPVADGFTLLSWLRSQPQEWRRVPVVMLTTSQNREEIMRAYDMGANSYLVKPTSFADLCQELRATADYWLNQNRRA